MYHASLRYGTCLTVAFWSFAVASYAQNRPVTYATKADFALVKASFTDNPVLKKSFDQIKTLVDKELEKDIDVPVPKDPAGGYTHERHKANYMLLFNTGLVYQVTGDVRYAKLAKEIFLKYAQLNPTLKRHPEATSASPGKLFWQALNDANWLVYAGMGYDMVRNAFSPEEKKRIVEGAFWPETNYFTNEMKDWFNLIHNHAVWGCAGTGIVALATDDAELLEKSLKGADMDGKAGFFAQLQGLFSPDGYYAEGPYYTRYAMLPFYLLANALNNAKPEMKVFAYRDSILKKALDGALQQTNLDGSFFSYNDALKEKNYTTNEIVQALSIARKAYGSDASYLPVVKMQNQVAVNAGGVLLGKELQGKVPDFFPYRSLSFTDGPKGTEGGVSILRSGKNASLSTLVFKYSSHGLSHGHYDKLNIQFFDQGNEVLRDYGAVRFIGIEQKWGGRYLPETKSFAHQTIAHNTLVMDGKSHYGGIESTSAKYSPKPTFVTLANGPVKASSAIDSTAYPGTKMTRTVFLIELPGRNRPLVMDWMEADTDTSEHLFDLPFQYAGQFISSNLKLSPFTKSQQTLGIANGYQHYWKEAEGTCENPVARFTFLNGKTFYTLSTLNAKDEAFIMVRSGAGDPDFNLRREPAFILRKKAAKHVGFLSVLEPHGNFDAIAELSSDAYPTLTSLSMPANPNGPKVILAEIEGKPLIVLIGKGTANVGGKTWASPGAFAVFYGGKPLGNNLAEHNK